MFNCKFCYIWKIFLKSVRSFLALLGVVTWPQLRNNIKVTHLVYFQLNCNREGRQNGCPGHPPMPMVIHRKKMRPV